ncbi:ArsR/SmtB family transcription factor [Mycoplasmopsis edwardii]|uniref:Predicted ArsR-family transcription repressor n=2 Tax=Mycoplasmopsis edwardii TaxID=53558 RepID=A0A3B0PNC1_9BACT|nr:ArsR family transcriptional regulator [Mycoplasmopsis edwardii]WBP84363.1 ArsR family transcriptional regulator [Mycoplasmopsis edwardii]SYV97307.1 predicted ArsR-family transcription repressor [Mycoplasmopsis edwardii]
MVKNDFSLEEVFSFLSKTVKKNIIMHLYTCHEFECDVKTLVEILDEKQANVSKHLNDLKKANIIDAKKDGIFSYYYLTQEFLSKYKNILEDVYLLDKDRINECICINDGHMEVNNN